MSEQYIQHQQYLQTVATRVGAEHVVRTMQITVAELQKSIIAAQNHLDACILIESQTRARCT